VTHAVDLRAYYARIGYDGVADATLATLRALHRLHPQAIAFENLSALLGEPVPLALPALQAKLLGGERGGWCFEHNLLLRAVLQDLGFDVAGLAAQVLWQQPADVRRPRSHMLLRVEVGADSYLADVGFGGLTLTAPLRLMADLEQDTPHGRFRLRAEGHGYSLWAQLPQGWRALYRFDLQPQLPIDYEYANWYLATHPDSLFRQSLVVARVAADGRHTLQDGRYQFHSTQGHSDAGSVNSVPELRALLAARFGIHAPAGAAAEARLAALLAGKR
jgi:N-hydroxyarylamine O-acetyltransferase